MIVPSDALARVRAGVRQAGSAWELTGALAGLCGWMGAVGWALMLLQDDGSHLFPCGISGLAAEWEPPFRPLESSGDWPACLAALGRMWTGRDLERPYPMPLASGPAAAAALPLGKSQGTLVAVRPGRHPFSAAERVFLAEVAEEVSDCLLELVGADREKMVPRLREVERGAFALDLTRDEITCDHVFARQHGLPAPGRYPLTQVLAALPAGDLPRAQLLLGELRDRSGTYEVVYRVSSFEGVRHLQARCARLAVGSGPSLLTGHVTDITSDTDSAARREDRMHRQQQRAEQMHALASACASATGTRELAAAACDVLAVFGADAVVLAEAAGDRIHVLTSHGQAEHHLAAIDQVALSADSPLTDALCERRAVFTASHEELVAAYPHYANTTPRLDRQAWAALPIPVSNPEARPAACMLSFTRPHAFTPEDQALLMATAGLLGRALDRCRSWDLEHARAVELQQGLLPAALPTPPGLELTASYLPAAAGAYAGGDWYDAFPTSTGRLLLAIGDVEGHDTPAASLMGRLRTAIRAYAALTDDPAELLRHTNRLLTEDNTDDPHRARTATCCLISLDPVTARMSCAVAGHPRPLVHSPSHPARELAVEGGLPLGTFADNRYPSTHHILADNAQLLLYTDGLTDRPGTDANRSRQRLRRAFRRAAALPGHTALDDIVTGCLAGTPITDDCALLLLRRHPPAPPRP
ncbi:PP2C family protein-serine/threonine phosphatase [Streptomyces sp. NPDC020801]|uniref:PP2C family protein-serine/threonine phosphatase n=1 Tax=unclassified Streptomyces TaxID=2593676 RepID=UPI00378F6707